MLFEQIKQDLVTARKTSNKLAVSTLSTLIGELDGKAKLVDGAKVVDDDTTVRLVKKFIDNIDETQKLRPSDQLVQERAILENYLPKMLTDDELEAEIVIIVNSVENPNIGLVMGELKRRFPNQYDGKLASQLARKLI